MDNAAVTAPAPAEVSAPTPRKPRGRAVPRHEAVLAGLLVVEIGIFAALGTNFFTLANAFEIVRVSAEIGLLALALTPVIVTGGIDLSVGSMMGLAAVVFGLLVKEVGLPYGAAMAVALLLGAAGGGTNALLVTRLRIPPLIVTLGTFSLFRGIAEGITGGTKNFTEFPEPFLLFGQGYIARLVPPQVVVILVAALVYGLILHRTTIGRSLYAIGFSPEGAAHAGIPVRARLALVYVLSGLVASFAAVLYVAHLGQAKADAGTSYELMAITAVVLGGTSIFGGRGTIAGTMLGLFAIAILQNGLRLADLPAELAGILSGVLLVVAILLNQALARRGGRS
jgi:rhamnose transport system permease protein